MSPCFTPWDAPYDDRWDDEPGCPDCNGDCYVREWREDFTRPLIVPCGCNNGVQSCPDIEDLWERCQDMADRFPNSTEIRI